MIIAVNTKIAGKDDPDENDNFIFETFSRIIRLHPEHTFVLIIEKKQRNLFSHLDNVIIVTTGPLKKNTAQWYIWYNIKIPAILKKYKADAFVSYGSVGSLTTKVPQCIIVPDLAFIHQRSSFKKSHLLFYKTFVPRSLKKAKAVITVSEFCKANIIKHYKINTDKTSVIYRGINEIFRPVSAKERENVKEKYAEGKEYFIYTGEIGSNKNLLNLLKAFSAFKKRQKSDMQLLIAGKSAWKPEVFYADLRLFRFKDDVKLLENLPLEELVKVTAAAYAMVYPSVYENFATQPLQAMTSGVPVITSSADAMTEICADAALYADPENFKEIAVKMMALFKDENLRKTLIEKGKIQAEKYNWNITAELLWKSIEKGLA